MCQATAYLNGGEILRDVALVENLVDGVRLTPLFKPGRLVPATLRRVDLMKHQVILESHELDTHEGTADELEKLRVLIPHWMEHNAEHAEEFRRWAQQAGDAGAGIVVAAEVMERVNVELAGVLEKLGGPLPWPG